MKYALNLGEDGRILSAAYASHAPENATLVEEMPSGNISDYLLVEGNYVYDPIPVKQVEEVPSQLERMEAQLVYTAMMTDTLLEVI